MARDGGAPAGRCGGRRHAGPETPYTPCGHRHSSIMTLMTAGVGVWEAAARFDRSTAAKDEAGTEQERKQVLAQFLLEEWPMLSLERYPLSLEQSRAQDDALPAHGVRHPVPGWYQGRQRREAHHVPPQLR